MSAPRTFPYHPWFFSFPHPNPSNGGHVNQTKKPLDLPMIVGAASTQIQRYVGGQSASFPAPIVVIGGGGPNGLVAMLGRELNRTLHIPDIRHIHTPDELIDYLNHDSQPDPMIVHCGELLPAHAQNILESYYKHHRRIAPRMLIVVIGVSPAELVKLGRWRASFSQMFAARIIDFETALASERKLNLRRFTTRLERSANVARAHIDVDPACVAYFEEILNKRPSTQVDHVISIADKTFRKAYRPEERKVRITLAHLVASLPPGFDDAVKPRPGQMIN